MRVLVVGAGIMGLCVARSLAERGAAVHLADRGPIPGAGSSSDMHRLIRFPYGHLSGYRRMVSDAYTGWNRLWQALGESHYVESGSLIIGQSDSSWIKDSVADLEEADISHDELTPSDVSQLVPGLSKSPNQRAVLVRKGGILLADRILQGIAGLLAAMNVSFAEHQGCASVTPSGETTFNNGQRDTFDLVVLCTGPSRSPGPGFRVPSPTHQTAVYLNPPSDAWSLCPSILDLTHPGGFYFIPPVSGYPAKLGSHSFGPEAPDLSKNVTEADRADLRAILHGRGRFAKEWEQVDTRVCHYDVSENERFVAERRGAVIGLSGFSGHGFKFGPLIGERLAESLLTGSSFAQFGKWLAGLG